MAGWSSRPGRDALVAGATALLLCLAGAWLAFGPVRDWVHYPLAYTMSRDALANLWLIKTVIETGSASGNPALGAPFGATFLDFPRSEVLFLLFYRVAGMVSANAALIHNAFYLAGFPLVAWSALAVLRQGFHVSWPLAVAGAMAFSWLPYHFLRLEHLHLSNYAVVPVAAWLVLRVSGERPPFFERGRLALAAPAVWVALLLVASSSIYYAFFAMVLVAGAGALEALAARSLRPAVSAALTVASLGVILAIVLAPALRYRAAAGPNATVAVRSIAENDIYALRPIHLLLPSDQHRFASLSAPARAYNAAATFSNENRLASLGLIGALGFVLLLLQLLTGGRVLPDDRALWTFARANVIAVLFGVTGGLGALVAQFLTPQFRALNRISVFIAFFSIAAVVTAIDRALRRTGHAALPYAAAVVLVVVAVVDQVPATRPDLAAIATAYDGDQAFVRQIEQVLPPGAMVYQWPHTRFPEEPPFLHEPFYSPLRMYLHSRTLRWSYGGMKGRPGDYWHQAVVRLPLRERLALLQSAGFRGLVLDRAALPGAGQSSDRELVALGAGPQFESADGTLAFYTLPPSSAESPAPDSLLYVPGRGFYPAEGEPPRRWNWSDGNAELLVHQASVSAAAVELTCVLESLVPRQVVVRLRNEGGTTVSLTRAGAASPLRARLRLLPGWNAVRFETDRAAVRPEGGRDSRLLAFLVRELRVGPVPAER
jgi:phosphoglycerol transferase